MMARFAKNNLSFAVALIIAIFFLIGLFTFIRSSQAQNDNSQIADIIVFHKPSLRFDRFGRSRLVELAQSFVGRVKYQYQIIDAIAVRGFPVRSFQALTRDTDVISIQPDGEVHAHLRGSIPIIGADVLHNPKGITGEGVKVCVLDTGIDNNHPAFQGRIIWQKDYVNDDNNAQDDNNHGSHVAGIVGSGDGTYTGVAPGVLFMVGKVLGSNGSGTFTDVIAGIDDCVMNGAKVINMSLGGGSFYGACDSDSAAMASNNAVDAGVVVVASSGNSGTKNAMGTPACGSKVIAVGATYDYNDGTVSWCLQRSFFGTCTKSCSDSVAVDKVICFSNGGSQLDVVAPGSITTSVKRGGGFTNLSGTSMASPHVAGLAALLLGEDPNLPPTEVTQIIRDTAVDLGPAGFDTSYGYGRIDAEASLSALGLPTPTPTPTPSPSPSPTPSPTP